MRIGLLIYGDIDAVSGGYLYDRKLASYLRRQGDTVDVISLPWSGYWRALLNKVPPMGLRGGGHYDVIIQDEMIHPSMLRCNERLRRLLACPVISLVHLLRSSIPAPALQRAVSRAVEKRYLGTVDGLILNSRDTLHKARRLMNDVLPPHVIAVPCGDNFTAAEAAAAPLRHRADTLALLYVGAVTRQKGLHIVLDALARLGGGSVTLTVTGRQDMEPGYAASMRKRARAGGLPVRFTGPMAGAELVQAYKSHDLLVLPSVNEAYGIVYLEAQRFALPAVATLSGGAKEVIAHGKNGYLIGPGDSAALAAIFDALRQDRTPLRSLAEGAFSNYQRHPVWDDSCRIIRQFLLEAVARHAR